MALEHAILVSLSERAGSGYQLARRFDKSIGFFWAATHQQIYRVLARMTEAGWVSAEEIAQQGRPDKKVYTVSAAGHAELERWLAEPLEPPSFRDELGVKLRGAELGGAVDSVLKEVERHRELHAERLAVYRVIERRDFPAPDELTGRQLHQYLVLRGGVLAEQSFLQWCDEVIQAISNDMRGTSR